MARYRELRLSRATAACHDACQTAFLQAGLPGRPLARYFAECAMA